MGTGLLAQIMESVVPASEIILLVLSPEVQPGWEADHSVYSSAVSQWADAGPADKVVADGRWEDDGTDAGAVEVAGR